MKNHLKQYTLIGIIFITIAGTLSHFVYEWSDKNLFLALFFPSIVYATFMAYKLHPLYPNIISALSAGILLGTFSIPVIFYTYMGILGFHTLLFDIVTFLLSVMITFLSAYFFTVSCKLKKPTLWISSLIALTFCFFFFSIKYI